jgi:DNA-binding MarR family transcriptional regulator
MMPPGPAVPTLLDQLRQSLGSGDTFLWRKRLLTERLMRNITEKHERALLYLRDLIEAGDDQPSHSELAETLSISISVIKDALKRGQALGLIEWDRQYVTLAAGSRRQRANHYRLCMPAQAPQPRPDVRRHRPSKPASLKSQSSTFLPTWSPHSGERPGAGFAARFAAKLAEEKQLRAARLAHRPP